MLAAYAGHAAAALDLIIALEDARQEADRAGALLELAHELSAATDAAAVTDIVSEALPRIVGCTSAGILLWDPATGSLRVAVVGRPDRRRRRRSCRRPRSAPRTCPSSSACSPTASRGSSAAPRAARCCGGCCEASAPSDVVAVPLLAGTHLPRRRHRRLGAPARRPPQLDGDVLARLRGVGDQATTALQKARLLDDRPPPGHARRPDRPAEPGAVPRPARARPSPTAGRRRPRRPSSSATSTGSSRSTTPSATRPATSCSGRSPRGCAAPSAPATPSAGSAATSSRSSCPGWSTPRTRAALADRVAGCFAEPFRLDGHRRRGRHQRRRRRARPRLRRHRRAAAPRGRRRDVPAQAGHRAARRPAARGGPPRAAALGRSPGLSRAGGPAARPARRRRSRAPPASRPGRRAARRAG